MAGSVTRESLVAEDSTSLSANHLNVRRYRALDLFAGLGGWSDGLAAEGFDVTGVEIEPKIAALYKHRVIVSDVCDLNPEDFKGYDLIMGSPPCRNFTELCRLFGWTRWKNPPDPEGEGMRLVNAFLRFVEIASPKYWVMENVPGLRKYYKNKPRCVSFFGKTMKRCLWGNFPSFLIPKDLSKPNLTERNTSGKGPSHLRMHRVSNYRINGKIPPFESWERARIPMPVARALGAAVKEALL